MADKDPLGILSESAPAKDPLGILGNADVKKNSTSQPTTSDLQPTSTGSSDASSQVAGSSETSGVEVEQLPTNYDRLNPKSYSNLQDGTNYFTGSIRNGKPVVKQWNAAKGEFQVQDDPKVLELAQTKFGKKEDIPIPATTEFVEKTTEVAAKVEAKKLIEDVGVTEYKKRENIANEAASLYSKVKTIGNQPQVSQYMQMMELYKQTDDPKVKEDISANLEELKNKPFEFQSTPTEGKEQIQLQTLPETPKFKTVGEAVDYTLQGMDESRSLLNEHAQTERDLQKINEEYQQLNPQDPRGFWYNAIRAVEEHSESLQRANAIALNSNEGATNELENSYIKSKIFPKQPAEGLGVAGEFAGGVTAAVAPTVGTTTAVTTATGNPLLGMLAGGAFSAQDMARIQYANGMQEMYNEMRDKNPDMPTNLAYETAKKYAKETAAVQGTVGLAVGMFLPALKTESIVAQKTSAEIAKKFFMDVAKNSGFDFALGSSSQGLNNYIAKSLGSDRSIFDGVLQSGGTMALQGLMVGTITHGIPTVSKYVTAKNREQAINSLASSSPEQLETVFENAVNTGSNPVEVQQLKQEVLERLEAFNQMPPNLPMEEKIKLAPLYEERQKLVAHLKENPASESGVMPEIEKLDRKIAEEGAYPLTESEHAEYSKLRDIYKDNEDVFTPYELMRWRHLKKRLEAIKQKKADEKSAKGGDGQNEKPATEKGDAGTATAPKIEPIKVAGTEVVEHGEDDNTAKGLDNGIKPTKLTEKGIEYAKELGKHVKESGKKLIITSDVERAKETGKIASEIADAKTESNPNLNTWDIGKFDGEEAGKFDEKYYTEHPDERPDGGESFNDFKTRMESAYNDVKSYPKDVQVVAHSKVTRAIEALEKTDGKWNEKTTRDFLKEAEPVVEVVDDGVKKTITTKRAYEGEFREGVKKELERIGLTREVESQAEAKDKAKEFIKSVGEDAALEAVRNNDVTDAAGAYVWNELIEATDKELATETDPAKIAELEKKQAELIDEFGKKALSGGRFASALGDIYKNSELGYNLQKKISEFKEQNGGVIPVEVEARFREYDKQLKEINTRLAEAEQRAKEAEEKSAIENIKEEVAREKKKSRPVVYGKKRIAKGLDDLASALGAKLSAQGDEAVKVTDALSEIGRGLIEEGIATTENVWQKVKEYVTDKFGDKIKDLDQYERNVKDQIEGGKTQGKIRIPKLLIKELVARGITDIDELVTAVKERVKDEYPNATDREIRDAITGYGKMVNLNKDEVSTQIRKLTRAGRIISALEDIAKKKRPLRSGAQRDKLDADERAMQKELREAMKGLPMDEGAEAEQLKTQLDAAKQRVQNQIDDLEREINNGEQVPKDARTVKDDAELKALKEKRDALKKEHDAIFKDDAFKEARRLELTKKSNERRLEELKRRLREGDFSQRVKKPLIADDELIKLRAEKLRVQEQYDVEFYKNKLANRTTAEKWKDRVWEMWSIPRALMATGEWSFVGVQGLINTVSHPMEAAQAFKVAWKSMLSEKETAKFLTEIKSQEWYPTMKSSKLSLTEPHAEVTAREETFNSGWSNLVWNTIGTPAKLISENAYEKWVGANPMKALERASVGYLDTQRVLRFLDGMQTLREQGKTFENSPQDYKDVADVINTFTGRASLGKAEQIAEPLSKIFFSPRNWASAFKTGTPYAFYHFGKMTPTARKMALADFSKFVGLTTSGMMLAAVGLNNDDDKETGVEMDPRSTDFMKIRLGNKRVDPWGGRQQQVVFTARIMADMMADLNPDWSKGGYKNAKGDIMRLGIAHRTPTKEELAMRIAVNKLGPSAALFNKYMSSGVNKKGERVDQFGQPLSVKGQIEESTHPIFWGTVADLYKDDPNALNGLLAFYAFFGGGVNIYTDQKKK